MEKGMQKLIDTLTLAHNTEIMGYFFYNFAAEAVEDERGRNVFAHLANEELDHIRVIAAIADSVKKGLGWVSYEEAIRRGSPIAGEGLPIFQKENELVERFKTNQTDMNAVHMGIENEEKAVLFYSDMLKKATEPAERVVLTKILEMEKGHLKLLRWEYESIVKNGFWCDMMEYSVEKELE